MRRREFLTLPAQSLGGLLLYTLAGEPIRMQAQEGEVRVPLRFFTAAEARVISAACERILPSDESGPGAKEAGVVIYIDRQLAGPYGRDKYRYTKGPWIESVPEHGYQGKANPRQIYREGIQKLGDFAALSAEQQDAKLVAIERTNFFQMLRTHTIEGMFCDPMHGGNAGMIGWQLIGFPGPVMSYREEIEEFRGKPFRRKPKSLADIVGHPVKGWEEETG
ncbi:MAG TPA: gluconate 2-dehydrogenase subunit 3 family protein [Bryobacteraceae bacterium]|nr:gluconate 2-dehydrogenase subunit 3 family protein [Bryobacteraceae bacterium]